MFEKKKLLHIFSRLDSLVRLVPVSLSGSERTGPSFPLPVPQAPICPPWQSWSLRSSWSMQSLQICAVSFGQCCLTILLISPPFRMRSTINSVQVGVLTQILLLQKGKCFAKLHCICIVFVLINHHFTNSLSILLRFSYSTKICAINTYKAIVNKKKPKVLRFQMYIIKSNVIGFEILSFQNVSKSATQSYIAQILVGSKVLFLRPESCFIIVSYGGGGGSQ